MYNMEESTLKHINQIIWKDKKNIFMNYIKFSTVISLADAQCHYII